MKRALLPAIFLAAFISLPQVAAAESPDDILVVVNKSVRRDSITAGELRALQRQHKGALKACYERALKRDDSLTELKAEVEVSIGDTGVVRSVRIRAGNNPNLVDCIRRSIKRWAFPSVGAQVFSFPIVFRGT